MTSKAEFLASLPEQIRNPNNCWVDKLPGVPYSAGYRPSLAAGVTFIIIFFSVYAYHVAMSITRKRWASIALAYGAFAELIGWAGRTWAAQCPYSQHAYVMQTVTLTIAPIFFTAALYMLLGQLIQIFGPESSMLSARLYTIVFLSFAFVAMIIQAVGGAMAASASRRGRSPTAGANTMIAGIIFQLATMAVFTGLTADFLRRISSAASSLRSIGGVGGDGLPKKYHAVFTALCTALACIMARNIFRAVELADGWRGPLMMQEGYFLAFDGFLMVAAVWIFIIFDPARIVDENADLLPPPSSSQQQQQLHKGSLEVEEVERGSSEGRGYSAH
ncbi:Rta1 domain protein [Apiospora marii]|uniref:Rta1 domain protein n=1 Tax=Apiospora marii TaxID=335849 RepID=A0ABR1RKT4_9PEZI